MSDAETPKPTALVVDEDDDRRARVTEALGAMFQVREFADIADTPDGGFVLALHSVRQLNRLLDLQQGEALSEEFLEDRRLLAEARRALRREQERTTDLQRRLEKSEERLRRLVGTDSATGLYNRRYFTAAWRRDVTRARRYGEQHAVLMIAVDGGGGTTPSLRSMQDVGRRLMMALRSVDLVARWSDYELVVSLPRTPRSAASALGERLREDIEAQAFGSRVTLSVGVAAFPDNGDAPGEILARARRAMLRAIDAGGNQSLVVGPEDVEAAADDSLMEPGDTDLIMD